MSKTLHYENDGPRCGKNGETTTKKSLVTCGNCRKAMKKRTDYRKQADVLFSKYIRQRDGRCVRCGTTEYLQCAHIIGRSYGAVRTDERNAKTMCHSCHLYFTHRPLEWEAFIENLHPGLWAELRAKALTYAKVDWRAEVERLSGLV